MNVDFFKNIIYFVLIIHAIDLIDWRDWNHNHSTIFSSILTFLTMSIVLIFWIFLIVFRLIICVHDSEFVIAYLIVVMKTIKIIDDLIESKFEKKNYWFERFVIWWFYLKWFEWIERLWFFDVLCCFCRFEFND